MNGPADSAGGGRRTFMKLALLAPLAVQQATRAAAEALGKQGAAAVLGGVADTAKAGMSAAGVPGLYYGAEHSKKLLALHKLGLLPGWFRREQTRNLSYNMAGIEPDIAGLVSVSLGAKCRMQVERMLDRSVRGMEDSLLDDIARQAFFDALYKESGPR